MHFRSIVFFLALTAFGLASCEKPHLDEVYEEPITSLFYVLTPDSGSSVVVSYLDRDGEGGLPAIINSARLQSNTSYTAKLYFNTMALTRMAHLIDSTSVAQEPALHQIFFLAQNGLKIETVYTDLDENGFPIGLESRLNTGSSSEGEIRLIVVHAPNKAAVDVMNGNIENANGRIDFETSFHVTVSN